MHYSRGDRGATEESLLHPLHLVEHGGRGLAARRADAGREKQNDRLGLTVEVDASGGDVGSERARDESSHTETVQGSIDLHQGQHGSVPQQ